jgi:lipopolysaccharide transport system permease protein
MSERIVIKPRSGWEMLDIKDLYRYHDLLYFLTVRSIKAKYAQSVLGIGWAIIQPLIQTLVFTIIFGNLAALSSDGAPYILFSFCAMVPWNYFSNILTESSNSLVSNRNLINKVYFPRLILPLSSIFSKLIDFGIGFIVLIGFLIYYDFSPSINILFFPFLLIILVLHT